ncbi:MAG: hypothetical protein ACK4NM_19560, partial [Hydrogenophaga sp.]
CLVRLLEQHVPPPGASRKQAAALREPLERLAARMEQEHATINLAPAPARALGHLLLRLLWSYNAPAKPKPAAPGSEAATTVQVAATPVTPIAPVTPAPSASIPSVAGSVVSATAGTAATAATAATPAAASEGPALQAPESLAKSLLSLLQLPACKRLQRSAVQCCLA